MISQENDMIRATSNLVGVVVDAGHGGSDPGASGNGIVEKNYTLKIAQYMANRFKALGVPVTLTRNSDETLTPEERVARILNAYGNSSNVVVISNHLNTGGGQGAEIVYALRDKDTLAKTIADELAKEGQTIRKWYQRRLPSDTSKDYYFIHRNTGQTEPVIIEYGFMDNATDASFIKNNWEALAEAAVRAVAIYKGIPYKSLVGDTYTVKSGDTLWSIAKKLNVGVTELKTINNLTSNALSIGQVLKIPGTTTTPGTGTTYTVVSGDNLYSIAEKYNVSVSDLKTVNNLTSNTLSIGQVLTIPATTAPSINTYTVVSGDNLYSIAQRFGVSVTELRNINNLTTDVLSVGQTLIIPTTKPSTGVTYTVVNGDNLYSIAEKYNVPVTDLKTTNNLTSNTLSIGQVLTIPSSSSESTGVTTYTVTSGDNLYSIAAKYGTTVDAIKDANNLTTNTLSIGQVLTIPGTSSSSPRSTTDYTVVKGDSLYSIAQKFNTTADKLKELNNLSSNLLVIGQVLRIPATGNNSENKTYTVVSGDNLYSIATKYGTTVDAIKEANNLSTNALSIGQVLIIP